jgi:hypothetical protein
MVRQEKGSTKQLITHASPAAARKGKKKDRNGSKYKEKDNKTKLIQEVILTGQKYQGNVHG